jgi:hypothetical protein
MVNTVVTDDITAFIARSDTPKCLTKPLLRSGLHNLVVPPLLGPDDIQNTVSSIAASWTVFTGLLPGNAFIKSVTILMGHVRIPKENNIQAYKNSK